MYTTIDKALIAAIMGGISMWAIWGGWMPVWLNEAAVISFVGLISPFLIWRIPNRT